MEIELNTLSDGPQLQRKFLYVGTLLLIIVGALVVYKATAAFAVIGKVQHTGTFQPRAHVIPLPGSAAPVDIVTHSINYFAVIWPALLFGVLISGAVRVLDPPRWLIDTLGGGAMRSHLVAGLAGAPLMLCSCCVAPVFSGLYERSSRLGPSLAVMLGAPSLNPAALVLTLMLFDRRVAITRLAMAAVLVFFTGAMVERLLNVAAINCQPNTTLCYRSTFISFVRSCLQVALRTIPLIAIGVFVSMAIALWIPLGSFSSGSTRILIVIIVALVAVPLALPTFFEIPLSLLLLAAGAPAGAAVAMLIAGPAINLPSILTIARSTNWKVATSVAVTVLSLSIFGGLLVDLL